MSSASSSFLPVGSPPRPFSPPPIDVDIDDHNDDTSSVYSLSVPLNPSSTANPISTTVTTIQERFSTRWHKWGVSLLTGAGFVGSVLSRIYFAYNAGGKWVSSLSAGVCLQLCVDNLTQKTDGMRDPLWRKASLTLLGMPWLFVLSELTVWAPVLTIGINSAVIGMLGANLVIVLKDLYYNDTSETHKVQIAGEPLNQISLSKEKALIFKLGLLGASIFSWVLLADQVYKAVAAFFTGYYILHIMGDRLSEILDDKIKQREMNGIFLTGKGCYSCPNLRRVRKVCIAASVLFLPFGFGICHRLPEFFALKLFPPLMGGVAGLANGFLSKILARRIENIPVPSMSELEEIDLSRKSLCARRAWKVGFVAQPALLVLGILAFGIRGFGWSFGDGPGIQIEGGAFSVTFLTSLVLPYLVDRIWNRDQRSFLKDNLMAFFTFSPQILWIPPAYLFYLIANLISMTGGTDPHIGLSSLAWVSYGTMGLEFARNGTRRKEGSIEAYSFLAIAAGWYTSTNLWWGKIE